MLKKALLSFFILVAATLPTKDVELNHGKSNIVLLSIGANYKAITDNYEDIYVLEAMHLEEGIESNCKSLYNIKKKTLHNTQATKKACLDGFKWLAQTAQKDDLAIVYIGCHGGGSLEGDFEFYPGESTVTSKEMIEILENVKSQLLVLVDTCHAGAIITDWKSPKSNISIIAACQADQYASIWKFVVPMVEALKVADYNEDEYVDIFELGNYVSKNITINQTVVCRGSSKLKLTKTNNGFLLSVYEMRTRLFRGFDNIINRIE